MNAITTIENLFSIKVLQSIVERTGDLVQHDVVIYNRDGIIIAATQKQRLGLFNEQIKDMVENENEFVFIESSDNENTIKPGINLLIRYERVPIGSVGITGDPKEVRIFGKLIQAFVEQQILYNKREKDKEDRKQLVNSFVYSWIFHGAEKKSNTFDLRAISLGIDVNLPRIVCIISAKNDYDLFDAQLQGHIEKQIRNIDKQNIITNFGNELVLLLSLSDVSAAENIMKSIHSSLSARSEQKYAIGIGCVVQPHCDIKLSYEAAKFACKVSKNTELPVVFRYDLELLVSSASQFCKQSLYNHTFRNYKSEEQIAEAIDIISNYINANRSLREVAQSTFMHENTVQQRLSKVHELTGYNPREAGDLAFLYSIVLMHQNGVRRTEA